MTLKELRMWHWRQMNYGTKTANQIQTDDDFTALTKDIYSGRHVKNAEFHLSAVQALNSVVPGSVEQDIEDDEKAKAVFVGIQESKAFTVEAAHKAFSVTGSIECHFTDKDAHKAFVEKDKFNGQEFGKFAGVQAAIASQVASSLYNPFNPTVPLTPCPEHPPNMCPVTCGHWLNKKDPIERCPVCQGNNTDMPCAYPGEKLKGCLQNG